MMTEKGTYHGQLAYGNSKLANALFSHELSRRLEGTGVTVNCMCPGKKDIQGVPKKVH